MIYESITRDRHDQPRSDPTRKWTMVMLSVATSIDALAVGLSMALLQVNIWRAALIIGLVATIMTILGMVFGREAGTRFGRWMEIAGGLVLIGIGVNILFEHLGA
jgi:putative Mn2+ efflux pump MntP